MAPRKPRRGPGTPAPTESEEERHKRAKVLLNEKVKIIQGNGLSSIELARLADWALAMQLKRLHGRKVDRLTPTKVYEAFKRKFVVTCVLTLMSSKPPWNEVTAVKDVGKIFGRSPSYIDTEFGKLKKEYKVRKVRELVTLWPSELVELVTPWPSELFELVWKRDDGLRDSEDT